MSDETEAVPPFAGEWKLKPRRRPAGYELKHRDGLVVFISIFDPLSSLWEASGYNWMRPYVPVELPKVLFRKMRLVNPQDAVARSPMRTLMIQARQMIAASGIDPRQLMSREDVRLFDAMLMCVCDASLQRENLERLHAELWAGPSLLVSPFNVSEKIN